MPPLLLLISLLLSLLLSLMGTDFSSGGHHPQLYHAIDWFLWLLLRQGTSSEHYSTVKKGDISKEIRKDSMPQRYASQENRPLWANNRSHLANFCKLRNSLKAKSAITKRGQPVPNLNLKTLIPKTSTLNPKEGQPASQARTSTLYQEVLSLLILLLLCVLLSVSRVREPGGVILDRY